MRMWWIAGATLALALGATGADAQNGATKDVARQAPLWNRLERFSDDAEFLRYVGQVRRLTQAPQQQYGEDAIVVSGSPPLPPPPPPPPPPPSAAPGAVAELAAPSSAAQPSSITNVQTQGVDEGGIVKQIGRFLIVLQDGRLFVVDTRPGDRPGLALASRTNVYRRPNQDTWYDEVLVSGRRILVTGYSYAERASEITVFTLNDDGALQRETSYYISSNDYYDVNNYATRLVNGNLVIYTPLAVSAIDPRTPVRWPLIRRWLRDSDRGAVTTEGAPLFDGSDIYKPIQPTLAPVVHSVSVCPLGELNGGDELECRTTAFVGGAEREFFVSRDDIYLWVTPAQYDMAVAQSCSTPAPLRTIPATVFQVPLSGAAPQALHARGRPASQLALDASPTELRALLSWNTGPCAQEGLAQVRYFHAPFSAFSQNPAAANPNNFILTPSPGAADYQVRFTDTHAVYGGRLTYGSGPPVGVRGPLTTRVIAVPVDQPSHPVTIEAPHNIIRIERAGNNIVLTGYADDRGLRVSLLDLRRSPRIASTRLLDGRFESENRSHAFNSLIGPGGDGVMGLPTVTGTREAGRWSFRSEASDVSYLTLNTSGELAWAGQLVARQDARDPSYRCEVSCIDWYGNTRALFIGDRVFALSATELIEGALANGRIREERRINLSSPVRR